MSNLNTENLPQRLEFKIHFQLPKILKVQQQVFIGLDRFIHTGVLITNVQISNPFKIKLFKCHLDGSVLEWLGPTILKQNLDSGNLKSRVWIFYGQTDVGLYMV